MKKINKSFSKNFSLGFTLIEMLIVVAIIAILSSAFLVGFRSFRDSAMDSRRLVDLQNIRNYLEIYYTKNRCYPGNGDDGITKFCPTADSTSNDYPSMSASLTGSNSASSVPNDPTSGAGGTYYYGASKDGQSYVLGANLTKGNSSYSDPTTIKVTTYGIACDGSTLFCIKN